MTLPFHRLGLIIAAGFLALALASGYWAYWEQASLTARADNFRWRLAEQDVRRGDILDRHGVRLATTTGEAGDLQRRYPYPALAPVLGYVSLLYGVAGIEASADDVLHGVLAAEAWFAPPTPGGEVRLTLDLRWQQLADQLLAQHNGALIVLDASTGELLALASHPTFDPNEIDAQWERLAADARAPLLNRATQALYQPGGALQPLVLAAALQTEVVALDAPLSQEATPLHLGPTTLSCLYSTEANVYTWREAFHFHCPQPFAVLGEQLGARRLDQLFANARFYDAPEVALPALAAAHPSPTTTAALMAIGQSDLTLTPLHLALVTAAIAREGRMPVPQLISATRRAGGEWQAMPLAMQPVTVFAPEAARTVKALMNNGHSALALADAAGHQLAWFSGFTPFTDARYVVVVLLEDGDWAAARAMGEKLLAQAPRP